MTPLITNDAIVLGILMAILGVVFITAHSEVPLWKKFYTYVPPLLLCYFRLQFSARLAFTPVTFQSFTP